MGACGFTPRVLPFRGPPAPRRHRLVQRIGCANEPQPADYRRSGLSAPGLGRLRCGKHFVLSIKTERLFAQSKPSGCWVSRSTLREHNPPLPSTSPRKLRGIPAATAITGRPVRTPLTEGNRAGIRRGWSPRSAANSPHAGSPGSFQGPAEKVSLLGCASQPPLAAPTPLPAGSPGRKNGHAKRARYPQGIPSPPNRARCVGCDEKDKVAATPSLHPLPLPGLAASAAAATPKPHWLSARPPLFLLLSSAPAFALNRAAMRNHRVLLRFSS